MGGIGRLDVGNGVTSWPRQDEGRPDREGPSPRLRRYDRFAHSAGMIPPGALPEVERSRWWTRQGESVPLRRTGLEHFASSATSGAGRTGRGPAPEPCSRHPGAKPALRRNRDLVAQRLRLFYILKMLDHMLPLRGIVRPILLLVGVLHFIGAAADPLVHALAAERQQSQIESGVGFDASLPDEDPAGTGAHWQCLHCKVAGVALVGASASSAPLLSETLDRPIARERLLYGTPRFHSPPSRAPPAT
jgi:hypothetical protein